MCLTIGSIVVLGIIDESTVALGLWKIDLWRICSITVDIILG